MSCHACIFNKPTSVHFNTGDFELSGSEVGNDTPLLPIYKDKSVSLLLYPIDASLHGRVAPLSTTFHVFKMKPPYMI